jgi:competence protein ComEC
MTMTEIKIWDVEHGSATYIKSPNGRHIIVDVGLGSYENGNDFSPLYHLWKNYGVKQIDYAILTHPHKDHFMRNILNNQSILSVTTMINVHF